jgi:DNA replicative helicase MCM subunit Mcm2 (Cdc46/Mcm family)
VIRQAYDTGSLRILTKTNPAKATDAHISIIGHITKQELIRYLTDTECANGFANRIHWVCVSRSKELSEGGNAHLVDFSDIEERLEKAFRFAQTCGEVRRNTEARERWRSIYHELSAPKPGLFGAITSRAEANVVRLSLVYALLDCSDFIRVEHLEAALAAWRYCEESARHIFGNSLGDPNADAILAELREAGTKGMTRTQINLTVFNKHVTKAEIDRALNVLADSGVAECKPDSTAGRAAERWYAK